MDVLVGNMMSNLLLAYVGPTTKQGKIILSGIAGPSKLAGEDCNPNVFVYSWENNSPSEVVGKLMTDAGMKKAFFLSQNFVTGREHAAGAKTFYKGEVVGEAYVPIAQVDYAGEIASIRASGADFVFVFLPGSAGIAFLKQFANSGLKDRVQLFSGIVARRRAQLRSCRRRGLEGQSRGSLVCRARQSGQQGVRCRVPKRQRPQAGILRCLHLRLDHGAGRRDQDPRR